ncbi:TPA: hypothetical protein MHW15_27965 [Klebsiella pneumoniae]|nr:hypothetical protein [Klebsiella pneumoniae]HBX5530081.1 hypothetical protein [Klebsiella pneumoniae]
MNLQKIYGFNEPFRFTGSSTGRWAVSIINISIRKTQMNDCLNWCISAFMLRKFAVAPSVPRLFWPACLPEHR